MQKLNVVLTFQFCLLKVACAKGLCTDEIERAKQAADMAKKTLGEPTIFSKIIDKSIPAEILYEDDQVIFIRQSL